jgi:hypothetical protein
MKLHNPEYFSIAPILPLYKPELTNETQELFDSISITTDIAISEEAKLQCSASTSDEICKESSCTNIVKKSMTNLLQLPSIVSIQNQSNNSKQFSNIVEIKKEIPESLISLSSVYLIKNVSDIDTLIFYLQEKSQISKEKLEQWKAKIAFEMRNNNNY